MIGLIGQKLGMTRIFTESDAVPVTVVSVAGNRVGQIKTAATDGYEAVQLAFGERRVSRLSAATKGHMAKYQTGAAAKLREFRAPDGGEAAAMLPAEKGSGDEIGATIFSEGQKVDVVGISKGKGFAGVIKRHHFRSNRASHGNSRAHRKPGSTGQCQDPGRTFPGKKMPGRLGGKRCTMQNLRVVRVDEGRNLLLIRGAIPGAPGGYLLVRPAVKGGGQ